uniref:Phosphoglycerate mutase n=1 Tax=Panagrolaimus sp. JU765 TaxID=591449 RepID=A0AC34QHS7_9BILA
MAPGRVIYLIRHGERVDNINDRWLRNSKYTGFYKSDNSPLSPRGETQGAELAKWFANKSVDAIFASPYDRTLDTATRMIGDRNIPIKPEAAFIEVLYLCHNPPGVRSKKDLKSKYPLFDEDYEPILNPWTGKLPSEPAGDDGCVARVRSAIYQIMDEYPGNIAIVSHAAVIGALLEVLVGRWTYVGQATVTRLVETRPHECVAMEISDASHLSDKTNLRPY